MYPVKIRTNIGKVKMHTLDIARPLRSEHHRRSAQVWHVFSRDFKFYLHTHTFIRNRNEPYLPLPLAGTHLPTPEGWKAEQTLVRSSPGRDSNLQPPDCTSNTLLHSHQRTYTYIHTYIHTYIPVQQSYKQTEGYTCPNVGNNNINDITILVFVDDIVVVITMNFRKIM